MSFEQFGLLIYAYSGRKRPNQPLYRLLLVQLQDKSTTLAIEQHLVVVDLCHAMTNRRIWTNLCGEIACIIPLCISALLPEKQENGQSLLERERPSCNQQLNDVGGPQIRDRSCLFLVHRLIKIGSLYSPPYGSSSSCVAWNKTRTAQSVKKTLR